MVVIILVNHSQSDYLMFKSVVLPHTAVLPPAMNSLTGVKYQRGQGKLHTQTTKQPVS